MKNPQDVPCGWQVQHLGDVVTKNELGGNYLNNRNRSPIALVKMGNLGRGRISLRQIAFIHDPNAVETKHFLGHGDLLFNTRNTLALVGKVAVWRAELSSAVYDSNILRLEFSPKFVHSTDYANYLFNSFYGLKVRRLQFHGHSNCLI